MKINTHNWKLLTGSALVLAATASVYAQDKPAVTDTNVCPVTTFFNNKIPDMIAKGKFSLNVRARYENADQEGGTPPAHAETIRTRFGYTTAPLYGFQAMIEAENTTAANKDTYAAGPGSPVPRDAIADPTMTEMNQAWLSYTYSASNFTATAKGGRQVFILDNHRFIGHVGWRQNMQTFDSAVLKVTPLKGLDVNYAYLWKVNRIFGDSTSLAAGTSDFNSASHVLNASYTVSPLLKATGYAYLLDLKNERPLAGVANNSCATYGGYLTGTWTFDKENKGTLGYRVEFAWQSDYADSTLNYETEYYLGELKATFDRFNASIGCEVLASDNLQGFRTPLATLHAHNGWADVFLNTPTTGLKDYYASVGATLPWNIPVNFVYHKFESEGGGRDFGQEYDAVISRKFGKNWTVLAKYAFFDGKNAIPAAGLPAFAFDKQVFWAEVEFNF